jgi:hypothetical protein
MIASLIASIDIEVLLLDHRHHQERTKHSCSGGYREVMLLIYCYKRGTVCNLTSDELEE